MRTVLAFTACTGIVLAGVSTARSQSSENSTGSSSSWHAGAAGGTTPVTHATAGGSTSSWSAGKGSFSESSQPGGIWRDGSTMGATTGKAPAGASGVATRPAVRPLGLAGLNRSAGSGAKQGAMGISAPKFSPGVHPSTAAHGARAAGASGGAHVGTHRVSGSRGGWGARRSPSISKSGAKSSSLSSGLESPMQSEPSLNSLSPSSGSGGLSPQLKSPLNDSSH